MSQPEHDQRWLLPYAVAAVVALLVAIVAAMLTGLSYAAVVVPPVVIMAIGRRRSRVQ